MSESLSTPQRVALLDEVVDYLHGMRRKFGGANWEGSDAIVRALGQIEGYRNGLVVKEYDRKRRE